VTDVSIPGRRERFLSSPKRPDQVWVTGDSSPGVRRLEYEVDRLPPFRFEVRIKWISASTPPYAFMAYTGTALPSVGLPVSGIRTYRNLEFIQTYMTL
jgi:hypothetical protein